MHLMHAYTTFTVSTFQTEQIHLHLSVTQLESVSCHTMHGLCWLAADRQSCTARLSLGPDHAIANWILRNVEDRIPGHGTQIGGMISHTNTQPPIPCSKHTLHSQPYLITSCTSNFHFCDSLFLLDLLATPPMTSDTVTMGMINK